MLLADPPVVDVFQPPRRPLLWVALVVAVGMGVDRLGFSPLVKGGFGLWSAAALASALAYAVLARQRLTKRSAGALLLCLFCLGGGWHHLRWNYFSTDDLGRFARDIPQPICVEAVVTQRMKWFAAPSRDPLRAIPTGPRSETTLLITQIRDGETWRRASGNCRLKIVGELFEVRTGDRVQVFARIGKPGAALNPGQYDWAATERGAGRHCELFCSAPECVTVVEPATLASVGSWVDRLGRRCEAWLARYVGPEQGDLALAIALGARERLNEKTFESFLHTGTVHLLVVSGMHVGLLASIVWWLVGLGALPQRKGMIVTAVLIVVYAAITGGRPPVIRATILVLSLLASLALGRRASVANTLAIAAIGIVVYNPSELFRTGTQLSFLCVVALTVYGHEVLRRKKEISPLRQLILNYAPWHAKILRRVTFSLGHMAIGSLVVWMVALPLVAYQFHIATPIAVLVTPLIWPLISLALGGALVTCTIGWLLPPVAMLGGGITHYALRGTRAVVETAQQFETGYSYCPGPEMWWVVGFYFTLALFVVLPSLRPNFKWQAALAAGWVAVGLTVAAAQRSNDQQLHCTFLAMGHGTCVVLELPGNQTVLYDAGSLGSPRVASRQVAAYLWSRGITRIDAIVLSHADVDHYNAVPGLVDRFDVAAVYVSPLMFDPWVTGGDLAAPNHLRTTLQTAGVPLREIWINDRLRVAHPGVEIEVFHPPRFGVPGRDNANSILLSIQFAGHRILLPGDLEKTGIDAVLAEPPCDCDVLLAPHHGAASSNPPGFAAWCTPEWVVVSGRHLAKGDESITAVSYRAVGAEILQTAESGAARFTLSAEGIRQSSYRSPQIR